MASSIAGDPPLVVAFANVSTGSPTAQLWTFGDGDISLDTHPAHVYQRRGIYTVTLTVWNETGSDVRVKQDLITVGGLAAAVVSGQGSVTEQPAWWLSLAISPWIAGAWYLYDEFQAPRLALDVLEREGRTLAALVAARTPETSVGSLDVVIERYLMDALVARRRANEVSRDAIDRSTRAVDGLREAVLLEALVRDASPEQLGSYTTRVHERLQEFSATLAGLGRDD